MHKPNIFTSFLFLVNSVAWNRWTAWTACSKSCDAGVQTRVLSSTCNNLPVSRCAEVETDGRLCNLRSCPGNKLGNTNHKIYFCIYRCKPIFIHSCY